MTIILDGNGLVLGRLASYAAQKLKEGEEVVIVNAEKVLISGNEETVLARYKMKTDLRGIRGKGPFYPRMPDQIVKRTVRGMVPWKKAAGKDQMKRFKAYIGVPRELEKQKAIRVAEAVNPRLVKFVELGTISKNLGAKF